MKRFLVATLLLSLLSSPGVHAEDTSKQYENATQEALSPQEKISTETLMGQATGFFNTGEFNRAEKVLHTILTKDPDNADAYWIRANSCHQQKKYREAEADYKRVIALLPEVPNAYLNLGWLLIETGKKDDAWEYCRKAHELAPESMAAAVNLGHLYFLHGEQDRAREYYRKGLALIISAEELKGGPLADFDMFAGKGWQEAKGKEWKEWFQKGFVSRQEVARLDEDIITLYTQGKYESAISPAKKVLALEEHFLGNTHPDVATSLNNLAALYNSTGRFDLAEPLLKKALKIRETALGPEHPDVAQSLNNLAFLYDSTARYDQAEPLYKRALKIRETSLGPDHPDVAQSLNNLAALYDSTGRYDQAEPLYKRALKIWETALGPDHPDVAQSLNNLAFLYYSTGRYALAEPLYKRALIISETALSPEHPDVARSLNCLAALYDSTDRYDQAELLYKRALKISETALGPDHPDVATSLNNLATLYKTTGRYDQAEPLYKQALKIREMVFGPEHPDVAISLNNLAALYDSTGRYDQAKPLYKRALKIASQSGEPQLLQGLQDNYSYLLQTQSNLPAAIFFAKQAVNTIQTLRQNVSNLGTETLKTFTSTVEGTYKHLADMLIEQGRLAEAQQVLGMLKEEEYFQFVRRSADTAPDLKITASFTAKEQPWHIRYEKITAEAATLGNELRSLREKDAKGVLTEPEQKRLTELFDEEDKLSAAFDAFITEMVAALQQEADILRDDAARDQRIAEIGRRNLPGTTAMMHTLEALGDGAVLLNYLMTEDRLHIILTTPDIQLARHADIGEADLNRKIFVWRKQLTNPGVDPRPLGRELFQALIAPVLPDLQEAGARTLMLSLDGALRYLPFAALYDGTAYLAGTYRTVMFAEVAKDKIALPAKPSWRVAALGVSEKVHEEFSPLTAVPLELSGIVRHGDQGVVPGEIHLNKEFTEPSLRRSGTRNNVVHIASHFRFRPGTEMDSSLLLGDGTLLTLAEVKKGRYFRRAELLTLSACETAMGDSGKGSEIEGFGAVAMSQGAKAVIATLWSVADTSTASLMQDFYRLREQNHLPKAEALRQAQLAFLNDIPVTTSADDNHRGKVVRFKPVQPSSQDTPAFAPPADAPYSHPYYWAPFILMGNWK